MSFYSVTMPVVNQQERDALMQVLTKNGLKFQSDNRNFSNRETNKFPHVVFVYIQGRSKNDIYWNSEGYSESETYQAPNIRSGLEKIGIKGSFCTNDNAAAVMLLLSR